MTNEPENDKPDDAMPTPDNALNDYDRIQEQLGEGYSGDPRLESGVPQDQLGSDIEFIQMSGLVRPSSSPQSILPPAPDDLDSSRPVSFFEKGVADVDADMVPGVLEDRATANDEISSLEQTQAAMSHLRDIIADLTKGPPNAAPDPALMAALDTPEPAQNVEPPEVSTSEIEPAPVLEAPVTLDDMLAEFVPSHPMHDDAGVSAPEPQPEADIPVASPVDEAVTTQATAPPVEPNAPARQAPVLPAHRAQQLAEAEKLLDELEPDSMSKFESSASFADEETYESPAGISSKAEADQLPDGMLDYKRQSKRRHRTPGKNQLGRSLAKIAAGLLIVSALAVATYTGYLWIQQRMVSPGQLFNQAARLSAKGDYAAASGLFEQFASLHPNDSMRAEAQFNAAFTMQLQKPADNDRAQDVIRQSLRLFEQYRKDNPTHSKIARAETLMGRLNYESGRYAEAIELLRDPELRLRDPASAVPALRTLARASAKMGDAEAARSYYLQAVGVQGNHSPDVDYAELGSLYQSSADHAADLDKRIELQQLAIDSWTHALEVPAIDPASKTTIRSQLDVLKERLQSEPGMAPAMESLNDATGTGPNTSTNEAPAAPAPGGESAPSETPAADQAAAPGASELAEPAAPAPASSPAGQAGTTSSEVAAEVATDEGAYVVKRGDTLTSIAEAHHTTLDDLKSLNALKGDNVFEGQHLLVPEAKP